MEMKSRYLHVREAIRELLVGLGYGEPRPAPTSQDNNDDFRLPSHPITPANPSNTGFPHPLTTRNGPKPAKTRQKPLK